MTVDIFVDKPLLTARTACNGGPFNKLPIQQAKNYINKIKHLEYHRLSL